MRTNDNASRSDAPTVYTTNGFSYCDLPMFLLRLILVIAFFSTYLVSLIVNITVSQKSRARSVRDGDHRRGWQGIKRQDARMFCRKEV